MNNPKTPTINALLLAIAALALTPLASAADPVRERIGGFKASKHSVATIEDAIAKDDKQAIAEQARLLASFADKIPDLYPPDAKGGFFSKAKASIWQNFPDFVAKAEAFQSSSRQLEQAAASQADAALMSQRLRQVQNSCSSCHDSYKRGR